MPDADMMGDLRRQPGDTQHNFLKLLVPVFNVFPQQRQPGDTQEQGVNQCGDDDTQENDDTANHYAEPPASDNLTNLMHWLSLSLIEMLAVFYHTVVLVVCSNVNKQE